MTKNIYHILNRGVEKREVFCNKDNYFRFAHNIADFNTTDKVLPYVNRRNKYQNRSKNQKNQPIGGATANRLVDVLCWAMLPNHPHIMVQEKTKGGASEFSRKLFGGYTSYFNEQNERNGVLFQGRSKIILVEEQKHYLYLHFYIHLNPLDLFQPNWRGGRIKNIKKAMRFLEKYKWSSYPEIVGKRNLSRPSVNRELFFELFDTNEKRYEKDLAEWLGQYEGQFDKYE
jgi:putative transposase